MSCAMLLSLTSHHGLLGLFNLLEWDWNVVNLENFSVKSIIAQLHHHYWPNRHFPAFFHILEKPPWNRCSQSHHPVTTVLNCFRMQLPTRRSGRMSLPLPQWLSCSNWVDSMTMSRSVELWDVSGSPSVLALEEETLNQHEMQMEGFSVQNLDQDENKFFFLWNQKAEKALLSAWIGHYSYTGGVMILLVVEKWRMDTSCFQKSCSKLLGMPSVGCGCDGLLVWAWSKRGQSCSTFSNNQAKLTHVMSRIHCYNNNIPPRPAKDTQRVSSGPWWEKSTICGENNFSAAETGRSKQDLF